MLKSEVQWYVVPFGIMYYLGEISKYSLIPTVIQVNLELTIAQQLVEDKDNF